MELETVASPQKCLAFINQMLARLILDVEAGTGAPFALRGLSDLFDCGAALILTGPEPRAYSYPISKDASVCADLVSAPELTRELERMRRHEVQPVTGDSILKNVANKLDLPTASFAVLHDFRPKGVLLLGRAHQELADFQADLIVSVARIISLALAVTPDLLIDRITELWTLKQLERIALMQIALTESENSVFSLALGNIDELKAVSNEHGHSSSMEVIKAVARRLKDTVRQEFFCAQITETEFAVLMPHHRTEQALPLIEKMREDLGNQTIELSYGPKCRVTVSFGLAEFPAHTHGSSFAELLRSAENALGRAKRLGKNRVYVHSQ